MFFVWKKNNKLRMMCDARRSNARFREPPGVHLATGDSISRLEIPAGHDMFIAHLDLADYFHGLRISDELSDYFALPPVLVGSVGARWCEASPLAQHDIVYPCFKSLPMGFTWALWGAQRCHEQVLDDIGGTLRSDRRMRDGVKPPSLSDGCVHLVYVDNMVIFGTCQVTVDAELERARLALAAVGFVPHELEAAALQAEALGVSIDGSGGTVELSPKRYWKLYRGMHAFVRRKKATGHEVRVVLGHLCFAFLLRRCCLSSLSALFRFAEEMVPRRGRPALAIGH